jgi:hypothetical protein
LVYINYLLFLLCGLFQFIKRNIAYVICIKMLICTGQFAMSQWRGSIFLWHVIKQILHHCRYINVWQLTGVLRPILLHNIRVRKIWKSSWLNYKNICNCTPVHWMQRVWRSIWRALTSKFIRFWCTCYCQRQNPLFFFIVRYFLLYRMRQSLLAFKCLVEAQGNSLRLHQLYYKLPVLIIKHSMRATLRERNYENICICIFGNNTFHYHIVCCNMLVFVYLIIASSQIMEGIVPENAYTNIFIISFS